MIESIRSSDKEGWFLVNDDIEICFGDSEESIQVDYDSDKYTQEEIKEIASELFEMIIQYFENRHNEIKEENEI